MVTVTVPRQFSMGLQIFLEKDLVQKVHTEVLTFDSTLDITTILKCLPFVHF